MGYNQKLQGFAKEQRTRETEAFITKLMKKHKLNPYKGAK